MKRSERIARQNIAVPGDVHHDLKEVAHMVGNPSLAFLAAAALRREIRLLREGRLELVNGELRSVSAKAA